MKIRQDATGQEIDIPDTAVGDFAAQGGYSFPEGTAVPVKHDDGTVSTVPVEQFFAQRPLYQHATQDDVQAHIVAQQKAAGEAEDAQLEAQYGEGVGNMLRAGVEGAARGVATQASDWAMKQAGVDAVGIREREKRNPISAMVGEAIGMIVPAILTGGATAVEEVGLKAAVVAAAKATPASIISHIGEAVGAKVAAAAGTSFTARVAAGAARVAAEGAIYGAAGDLSARAFDGQELLSGEAMQEYLHAAGYGVMAGAALGGAGAAAGVALKAGAELAGRGLSASKRLVQMHFDAAGAPVREAEAELAAVHTADLDGETRALQQKYDGLKPEDFTAREAEVAALQGKLEAAAPKGTAAPLPKVDPNDHFVYHSTPFENVPSIAEGGLQARNGGIFFANTPEQAAEWNYRTDPQTAVALRAPKSGIAGIVEHPDRADWNLAQETVAPHKFEYFDPSEKTWRPLAEFQAGNPGFRDKWGDVVKFSPPKSAFAQTLQMVQSDAERLGVGKADARTAMERIKQGRETFSNIDAYHAEATTKISRILDEYSEAVGKSDELVDYGTRVEAIGREMAVDPTAPPPAQIVEAMRAQHARMRGSIADYLEEADPQLKSTARRLDKFLAQNESKLSAIGSEGKLTAQDAIEAYKQVDLSRQVLGRVRASLGPRSKLGIGTMSESLANMYEETRQVLKNPAIVGDRAAEIEGRAKAAWTEKFDVGSGFDRALMAQDSGGGRILSGFGTYDRGDPAKVARFLKGISTPETRLQLELVSRNVDADIERLTSYKRDLKPGGEASKHIETALAKARELADELTAYHGKDQLAREYAALTAPAAKELEAAESKLATDKARAAEKLVREQEKIAGQLEKAGDKSDAAREKAIAKAQAKLEKAQHEAGGGIAGAMLDAALTMGGAAVLGPAGAIVGHGMVHAVTQMSAPVLRAVAKGALQSAIKTGETMGKFRAAMAVGKRLEAAIGAIDDSLRAAPPTAVTAKMMALHHVGELHETYKKASDEVIKTADRDPRAAYLLSVMPPERPRTQLRPDLDQIPTISKIAQRAWLRSYRGAVDPIGTVHRAAIGAASREEMAAFRAVYPGMAKRVGDSMLAKSQRLTEKPSMRAQRNVSRLVGAPLHFTDKPEFASFVQAAYQAGQKQGQADTDLSSDGGKARQVTSKGASAMASPSQRLENGLG